MAGDRKSPRTEYDHPVHTRDPTSIDPGQAQLDAYNARDIDRFSACYAEDVRVLDLVSGSIKLEGRAALHEAYKTQFESLPNQHAELVARQFAGEITIDTESVTREPSDTPTRVIAIYKVEAGLITHVWFTPRF